MKSQENATVSTLKKKRKQSPRFMRIFVKFSECFWMTSKKNEKKND